MTISVATIGDIAVTVAHTTFDMPGGLESTIRRTIAGEGFSTVNLSIVLTDHETVRALNKAHLGRDYVTDVLAFDLSSPEARDRNVLEGEIYVDLDTAFERSPEFETSFDEEVRRYVIHGLLHLMGYRDDDPERREEMKRLENLYLELPGT